MDVKAEVSTTITNEVPKKRSRFGHVHTLRLPISGERVRVRRPSTFSLVANGVLPAELTTLVWKLFGSQRGVGEMLEEAKNLADYTKLVEGMIPHILVDPQVVPAGSEAYCEPGADGVLTGTVELLDLPDLDKNHIFMYGVGAVRSEDESPEVVAADLAPFPGEPARPDAGPGGEAVRPAAEQPGGAGPA